MVVIVFFGLAIIGVGVLMRRLSWSIPEWPGDDEYLNVPREQRTFMQRLAAVWAPRGFKRSYAVRRRNSARDFIVVGAMFVVLGVLFVFLSGD